MGVGKPGCKGIDGTNWSSFQIESAGSVLKERWTILFETVLDRAVPPQGPRSTWEYGFPLRDARPPVTGSRADPLSTPQHRASIRGFDYPAMGRT